MRLEEKIIESKEFYFSRIKKSLTINIAVYSLAFGATYYTLGCGDNGTGPDNGNLVITGKIVFQARGYEKPNWEIYKIDSSNYELVNLTNSSFTDDLGPKWSPDGTKIAFYSFEVYGYCGLYPLGKDCNSEIYVMDEDGSNQEMLTNSPEDDWYPVWSPDGSKIIYESKRDGNKEIYIMDADGNNQTNLTNDLAEDYRPKWSPDGSKIAFHSNRDGDLDIYVMNADGSNQFNITNNPAYDSDPAWTE